MNSYVTGLFRRERTNAPIFAMIRDRLKFRSDSRLPSLGSVEPLPRIPRQRDQLAKLRNRLFYRESPARLRSESWSSLISPALKRLPRDRVKSVGFVNEADARRSYASFASVCFWNTWRIRRCLEGVPCCQSKRRELSAIFDQTTFFIKSKSRRREGIFMEQFFILQRQ